MADSLFDFSQWGKEMQGEIDGAIKDLADETMKVVTEAAKEQSKTVEGGKSWDDYIASFSVDKKTDSRAVVTRIIHAGGDKYRLTHLLEKGHATRNGGRTRKFPHFMKGQEFLDSSGEQYVAKKLEVGK